MSVQTIRLLYEFLTGTLENMEIPTDLFIEIFHMFKRLKGEVVRLYHRSVSKVGMTGGKRDWMKRYVMRDENKGADVALADSED